MKRLVCLFALALFVPILARAAEKRDDALAKIDNCLKREVPGHHWNWRDERACKNMNKHVQVLVDVYKRGDKSVLPTLFRFTYLTDFYDESLLSDPDGFLAELSTLSEKEQRAVANGLAGGMYWLRDEKRFEQLRALLRAVPATAATASTAKICLDVLETNNAASFLNYFPPRTFAGPAATALVYWYSRELYSVDEQPLWPPAPETIIYRFTLIGAFTGTTSVSLTLDQQGVGQIKMKGVDRSNYKKQVITTAAIGSEDAKRFISALTNADFWNMPAEGGRRGMDGAEWILEAAKGGNYHVVTRWCPGLDSQFVQERSFAAAAELLLELAGRKHRGGC